MLTKVVTGVGDIEGESVHLMPLVSVIVPSYNKPEYLPECLESIRAQTFADWECIVVSDGSPRVEEIRAAVAAMGDGRFRLLELKVNRGPAAARNAGVRSARGSFCLWADEDDVLSRDCLMEMVTAQQACGDWIIRPQIGVLGEGGELPKIVMPSKADALVRSGLYSVGFLFDRRVIDQVGPMDESPELSHGLEDVEWWIRVIWADISIRILDQVLYWYRRAASPEAMAHSQHYRGMRNALTIAKYMIGKHAEKYHKYPKQKEILLARAIGMELVAANHERDYSRAFRLALRRLRYECSWRNVKTAVGLLRQSWHAGTEFRSVQRRRMDS